ncbi:hypothetical protein D3C87_1499480 [compost metagenome]
MQIDDAVFIERPQVQGLLSQLAKAVHLDICNLDQVLIAQRLAAKLEQLQAQGVLVSLPFLLDIAQGLHRLQEAIDGALGHHDPLGQLGDADLFLLAQCLQDAKHFQYRRD